MITVIVAHKHRLVRQALAKILSLQNQIVVIGDAANGVDAIKKAKELMPDVVVVDSVLPGLNGLLKGKSSGSDRPEVVVFPQRESDTAENNVRHLTYDDDITDLIRAVLGAGSNGITDLGSDLVSQAALNDLTKREKQVLTLLADGLSNKQIARKMLITERTVKYHISNILKKLDLFSRTEAAIAFLKSSLNVTLKP